MIHERKFQKQHEVFYQRKFRKHHEVFLEAVKEKDRLLGTKTLAIVTDRETGIINAIKKFFFLI